MWVKDISISLIAELEILAYFQVWKNGEKRGVFSTQPLQMFISRMWDRSDSGGGGEQPYYGVLLWDRLYHLGIEGGNGKKLLWFCSLASSSSLLPTHVLTSNQSTGSTQWFLIWNLNLFFFPLFLKSVIFQQLVPLASETQGWESLCFRVVFL